MMNIVIFSKKTAWMVLLIFGTFGCTQKQEPENSHSSGIEKSHVENVGGADKEALEKEIDELFDQLKQRERELATEQQRLHRFQRDLNEEQLRLANLQTELRKKEIKLLEHENKIRELEKSLEARQASFKLQRYFSILLFIAGSLLILFAFRTFRKAKKQRDAVTQSLQTITRKQPKSQDDTEK
ncbi:MAG: hypothetical protein ACE5IR_05790 [bacterium]